MTLYGYVFVVYIKNSMDQLFKIVQRYLCISVQDLK